MFRAPRGTGDILPEEQPYRRKVERAAEHVASTFGYGRIDTPVFEDARLFVRGIGQATDVVEKETYTFLDRGGEPLTLRPEGTAPVCRAYIEHGMANLPQPVRLYYFCPIFRYERPQSGRYRQHHQFGIEALGDADAAVDAEVIEVAWRLLDAVGLRERTLLVNSIGDQRCRLPYIESLRAHYQGHADALCPDCKRRLEVNPLRLLDCKQDSCQPAIGGAPRSVDYLCPPCASHWEDLLGYLRAVGVPFTVVHRLVRGFDYYTRTVFEIVPPVEGRQSTIVGGGRYDGLIEELGGRPTPGVGFGMGIERVADNLKRQGVSPPARAGASVVVAHLGAASRLAGMTLATSLRSRGVVAILAPGGKSLKAQLRYASAEKATHAVIVGDDEMSRGVWLLRDLGRGEQRSVDTETLYAELGSFPPQPA